MFFTRKTPTPEEVRAELEAEREKAKSKSAGLLAAFSSNVAKVEAVVEQLKDEAKKAIEGALHTEAKK